MLLFFILNLSGNAEAAMKRFSLQYATVSFDVPNTWQAAPNLFGVPLMLLGEPTKESRTILSVVPTQIKGAFDPKSLAADVDGYKNGREAWLKKMKGQSLEYFAYINKPLNAKAEMHFVGYRYKIGEKEFIEHSYFVTCDNTLFQMKVLFPIVRASLDSKIVDSVLRSFSCK